MKEIKAPATLSEKFYIVMSCESGECADGRPTLFAVCETEEEAKKIIHDAMDIAKRDFQDELIYDDEMMEMHDEEYRYSCVYDYEEIDCSDFIKQHLLKI